MMNISLSHPVPSFGDSFTITCYTCGMPSSKEWAQKARSRPCTPMKPYFPFLLQISPTGGAMLHEDGCTYLCAFCHASLEAQWHVYEAQQVVPPPNRKYNVQKFICAVCAVETYRKRIRALPFQEFPFLEKQRQSGSITLGNNPLAIVCLDCSETLWAQSAEYDRWGLPVQKRHFNWMARPPPPEDSVEATVARLPSGETQLPRCPPIEPAVNPSKSSQIEPPAKILDASMSKVRSKGKGESPKMESTVSHMSQSSRKTSLTSTTPPSLDMGGYHNQPVPVVTVAPMSSHSTVISIRKDSLAIPPALISSSSHPHSVTSGMYPQSAVFSPAASYSPYVWGNAPRESQRSIEAYPYGSSTAESIHAPGSGWSWLPHPPPELLRYSYMSSLQNRTHSPESLASRRNENSSSGSPTNTPGPSSSLYNMAEPSSKYNGAQASSMSRNLDRGMQDERATSTVKSHRRADGSGSSDEGYPIRGSGKGSPNLKTRKSSPKPQTRETEKPSSVRPFPSHPKKPTKEFKERVASESTRSLPRNPSPECESVTKSQSPKPVAVEIEDDKNVKREYHIPKKRNWQAFMNDKTLVTDDPKKGEEIAHPKKKKSSMSTSENESVIQTEVEDANSVASKVESESRSSSSAIDLSAMDLSIAAPVKMPSQALKSGGAKFMIEYLCKGEPSSEGDSSCQLGDDSASRTSVIKCAPKVPLDNPSQTVKSESDDSLEGNLEICNKSPVKKNLGIKNEVSPKECQNIDESADAGMDIGDVVQSKDNGDEHSSKDDNNKEGNSESKEQDSRIHDVDEKKNEDLQNVKQLIQETITEHVQRAKEKEQVKQEKVAKQREFLLKLGLITPDQKNELEIKKIVRRHEKKTLPPLKLRADAKDLKIDSQLKSLLLKVALEDPSLLDDKPQTDQCDFMAELGLKAAEKSEKTSREMKWRVILMERVRRELRSADARGVKHEWEKSELLNKFAEYDLEAFFDSLNLPTDDCKCDNHDNDLKNYNQSDRQEDGTCVTATGMCINYPKYIPSYVKGNGASSSSTIKKEEATNLDENQMASSINTNSHSVEPILKIPVIPSQRRIHSESSTTGTSDIDESDVNMVDDTDTNLVTDSACAEQPDSIEIDRLILNSATHWELMKRNIDIILNDLTSSKEDISSDEKANRIDKIRKHLKTQLMDIKEIEKRLRSTGKTTPRKKISNKD